MKLQIEKTKTKTERSQRKKKLKKLEKNQKNYIFPKRLITEQRGTRIRVNDTKQIQPWKTTAAQQECGKERVYMFR